MAGKTGPAMFADLTHDETWILASKLMSGAVMASHSGPARDHDTCMDIHDVIADVQANWNRSGK